LAKESSPSLVAAALKGLGAVAVLAAGQNLALLASFAGPSKAAPALVGALAVAALRVAIASAHGCNEREKS
jgi:hypothetical protein